MLQGRKCKDCGTPFTGGPRAYYCHVCRSIRQKQAKAAYQSRKRQGYVRTLGSKDKCERCGKEYTVEGGLQRFCPDCQPIHASEHDRKTALSFYHENKERINPPRKVKRRKRDNKCLWCGSVFEPVNGSVTCSDDCRRQHRNRSDRERYKRQKTDPPTNRLAGLCLFNDKFNSCTVGVVVEFVTYP